MFDRILCTIKECANDISWRVRYMVANDLADFCEAYKEDLWKEIIIRDHIDPNRTFSSEDMDGPEEEPQVHTPRVYRPIDEMIAIYAQLLTDDELEVRTRAITKLVEVAKVFPEDAFLEKIEDGLNIIATGAHIDNRSELSESVDKARIGLAGVLLYLAPIFGKEVTVRRIIPLFLKLIRDDSTEVRLKLIATLSSLTEVISDFDFLTTSLLPSLEELAADKNWRTRLTVLELSPTLAVALGEKMFMERYHDVCFANWFEDQAYAVRLRAAEIINELCDIFGVDRCIALVLPWLIKNTKHTSYLIRVNVLLTITVLAKKLGEDLIISRLLPIVTDLCQDPVANVRIAIARAMYKIGKIHQTPAFHAETKKILDILAEKDEDPDVLFFVKESRDALIKVQPASL